MLLITIGDGGQHDLQGSIGWDFQAAHGRTDYHAVGATALRCMYCKVEISRCARTLLCSTVQHSMGLEVPKSSSAVLALAVRAFSQPARVRTLLHKVWWTARTYGTVLMTLYFVTYGATFKEEAIAIGSNA